jgi:D-proline reductase (dithiol) PrdB
LARLRDLKLAHRLYMRAYRYRQVDWRPGAKLRKPLAECTVAVITTAAFHLREQAPFDPAVKGGDYSYREIPADSDRLLISHKSDAFDHTGIERDYNLALPLDRLRELRDEGFIGKVAARHYSLMGSITAPARLVEITAPELVRRLADDGVDAVLLTPV